MHDSLIEPVYEVSLEMLKQWNKNVLKQWIEVYSLLIKNKIENTSSIAQANVLVANCAEVAAKMSEVTQPIAVRVSSASLIAALAFYNSLGSKEAFLSKNFLRRT